uniref:Uncharacterized protein n=1 Tax=Crocodylus porosus TaxID=8502 RepID=A0A7M4EAX9_CROPO
MLQRENPHATGPHTDALPHGVQHHLLVPRHLRGTCHGPPPVLRPHQTSRRQTRPRGDWLNCPPSAAPAPMTLNFGSLDY